MVLPFFVPIIVGAKIIFEAAGPMLLAVAVGHRNDTPKHGGKFTAGAPKEIHRDAEETERYHAERRAQCEEMILRTEERMIQYRKGDKRSPARRKHDRTREIVLQAQHANRRKLLASKFNPDRPLTIAENEATTFAVQPVWNK